MSLSFLKNHKSYLSINLDYGNASSQKGSERLQRATSAAQHSTAQHNTAQYSRVQYCVLLCITTHTAPSLLTHSSQHSLHHKYHLRTSCSTSSQQMNRSIPQYISVYVCISDHDRTTPFFCSHSRFHSCLPFLFSPIFLCLSVCLHHQPTQHHPTSSSSQLFAFVLRYPIIYQYIPRYISERKQRRIQN